MLLSCFHVVLSLGILCFTSSSSSPPKKGEMFCLYRRLLADTNVVDETAIAGGTLTVPLADDGQMTSFWELVMKSGPLPAISRGY